MITIGITGGVGAGKSTVLDFLEEKYQAYVMKADEIGHLVMEPGQVCYEPVIALFGKQVIKNDKTIDRRQISDVVFSHPELLEKLNQIIHPAVKKYLADRLAEARARGDVELFFVEAALLIENGFGEVVDEMWYIYAREEVRRKRLSVSRGYTPEKIGRIMSSQLSEKEFRKHCDFVIDNSDSLEDSYRQIRQKLEAYTWRE